MNTQDICTAIGVLNSISTDLQNPSGGADEQSQDWHNFRAVIFTLHRQLEIAATQDVEHKEASHA